MLVTSWRTEAGAGVTGVKVVSVVLPPTTLTMTRAATTQTTRPTPPLPAGAWVETGRLCARLLSLALWEPPLVGAGLGVFPPVPGFLVVSAIVPQSPIGGRAPHGGDGAP